MTPAPEAPPRPETAGVVRAVAGLADDAGRRDLGDRLRAAAARSSRPTTIVCVVGEFKQGKSTLVNALLGLDLCPVDDDLATSTLTLVHHGDVLRVTVRRADGAEIVPEDIEIGMLRDWVTEAGNPENAKHVERVDIQTPSGFLAEGVALVDTPGAGGVGSYSAATLAFLPFADALVFVSDASAELSAPEIEFLVAARDRCPVIIHALTKVDLYAEWRRMAALDRDHLARAGVDAQAVALSAPLRTAALATVDAELNTRSGYPALLALLREQVIRPARSNAERRAAAETTAVLDLLETSCREELAVLADPRRLQEVLARLETARARLEHLRGPGARWSTLVADRIADLSNDATFAFRGAIRDILRDMDEAAEALKTPDDWQTLAARLQERVAGAVAEAFGALERGGRSIREAVTDLLEEEAIALPALSRDRPFDARSLWRGPALRVDSSAGRVAGTLMTGLRGAQSGILMFGLLGRFAPAGVAAVMLSNPVTIGLGAAFAGMQLLDANRRRLAALRQQARTHIRQFLDDVQFEAGNRIGQSLRDMQRGLRDDFSSAIDELMRTYTDLATQAQQAASADAGRVAHRSTELEGQLARIGQAQALLAPIDA